MFRFHLVKEKPLLIDSTIVDFDGDLYVREVTIPVIIESTGASASGRSKDDEGDVHCAMLKSLLEDQWKCNQGFNNAGTTSLGGLALPAVNGQQKESLDWSLQVAIGMVPYAHCGNYRDFIRVTGTEKGNLLEKLGALLETHGVEFKMMVEIKDFTSGACGSSVDSVVTKEVTVKELTSNLTGSKGARLYFSGNFDTSHWHDDEYSFTGVISITAIIYSSVLCLADLLRGSSSTRGTKGNVNRKILEDQVNCDATIIACDGKVKCHKAFLTVQSPVLQAMFKDAYKESKTNTVEMLEMTSEAVKALLEYLYHEGIEKALDDSGIALDLFKAGHKYDVPELEERMKAILLSKPDNWFEVDVAMMLYLFARNLQDGERLKKRAVKLLKLNEASLETSPTCKKLFEKDPIVALELFKYLCSNCTM